MEERSTIASSGGGSDPRGRHASAVHAQDCRIGSSARQLLFSGLQASARPSSRGALAEFMFDDEHSMVRIEHGGVPGEAHRSRLIGAPPGYVGLRRVRPAHRAVRRRPYSVVLFDEIEKAHPSAQRDAAAARRRAAHDGKGRTVDSRTPW